MINFYQTHINEVTIVLTSAIAVGLMLLPTVMCRDGKPTFLGLSLSISIAAALFTMLKVIPEGSVLIRNSALVFLLILYILVRVDIYMVNRTHNTVTYSDDKYTKYAVMSLATQGCLDIGTVFLLFEILTIIYEMH